MFEDVLTWKRLFRTGSKPKRFLNLLEEEAFSKVALDIELEGNWNFSESERSNVLRRIREMYTERSYPQATFEDWYAPKQNTTNNTDDDELDSLDLESDNETDTVTNNADFDAFVKKYVSEEFAEGKLRDPQPDESRVDSRAGPSRKRRQNSRLNNPEGDSESDSSSDDSSDSDSSNNSSSDNASDKSSSETNSDSDSSNGISSASDSSSEDSDSDLDSDSDSEIEKPKSLKKRPRAENDDSTDLDNTTDADDSLNPDIIYARKKLKQWRKDTTDRSWYRKHYTLHKAGFEPCGDEERISHKSTRRQHIVTLKTLLHLKVLEKDWQTAFKTFALLTKIPNVDLRSLWPVGVEILTQLRDDARAKPSSGTIMGRQEQNKVRQFFEWMTLSFPMQGKPRFSSMPNHGPVFRTGSKTYTPIYKVAQLCNLLTEKRYTMLRDEIEEKLLMPPYDQDGAFHYMLILCCLSENADLLSIFEDFDHVEELNESEIGDLADDMSLLASRETLKSRIFSNHAEISSLMEKCQSLSFEFPRKLVRKEMEKTRARLENATPEPEEIEPKVIESKKFFGYLFQKGEVIPAKAENLALPRKYWDRITIETDRGGTKHWVGRFFDYSKQNKAMCLLCGTVLTLRQRKALKSHLETHDITSENQSREQINLKNFDMAEMVKRQKEPIGKGKARITNNGPLTIAAKEKTKPKIIPEPVVSSEDSGLSKLSPILSPEVSLEDDVEILDPVVTRDNGQSIQEPTENGLEGDSFVIHDENKPVLLTGNPSQDNTIISAKPEANTIEKNIKHLNGTTTAKLGKGKTLKTLKKNGVKDTDRKIVEKEKVGKPSKAESIPLDSHPKSTEVSESTGLDPKQFQGADGNISIDLGDAEKNTPRNVSFESLKNDLLIVGPPEYDTSGSFLANHIDDSMDGQRIARSQKNVDRSFKGFSPDATFENQTFNYDVSRDISRDFHQFASQTQDSQMRSQLSKKQPPSEDATSHNWRDEFSSDLNHADTSINFTRFIPDSLLVEEGKLQDAVDTLVLAHDISD